MTGSVGSAQTVAQPTDIGDELALRAGLDPDWLPVLAVYLAGAAEHPGPFTPRP